MPGQGGLLASLRASDNDTGINAMLTYELIADDAPIRISAEGERISSRRISRHISTEDLDLSISGGNNEPRQNHNHNRKELFIELGDGNDDEVEDEEDSYEDFVTTENNGGGGGHKKGSGGGDGGAGRRKLVGANPAAQATLSSSSDLTSVNDRMVNEDATSNQRAADVSRFFMVRPNDGSIVLKQMVDYERAHEFRFSVVVKDSGIPALSSTARVVVEGKKNIVKITMIFFLMFKGKISEVE